MLHDADAARAHRAVCGLHRRAAVRLQLIAGWVENWFVFHRLDIAIAWNPRIHPPGWARRAPSAGRSLLRAQHLRPGGQHLAGPDARPGAGVRRRSSACRWRCATSRCRPARLAAAAPALGWDVLHDAGVLVVRGRHRRDRPAQPGGELLPGLPPGAWPGAQRPAPWDAASSGGHLAASAPGALQSSCCRPANRPPEPHGAHRHLAGTMGEFELIERYFQRDRCTHGGAGRRRRLRAAAARARHAAGHVQRHAGRRPALLCRLSIRARWATRRWR